MANTYNVCNKLQAIADAITQGGGGGGGTTVIANPAGTPTADLNTVQIGQVIYDIPGGGSDQAVDINYDNTTSGLTATNVQDAIDENADDINTLNSKIATQTDTVGDVKFTRVGNIVYVRGYGITPSSLPTIPEAYRPLSSLIVPAVYINSNKLYNAYLGLGTAGAMNPSYSATYAGTITVPSGGSLYFTVAYEI